MGTQLHAPVSPTSFANAGSGESADIDLLHAISVELIGEQDRVELYGKIVDAAITITGSQFGTMQLLCPDTDDGGHGGYLRLLCSRGLPSEAVDFWQWVGPAAHSSCTRALRSGRREIIPDYEMWDEIAGTEDLQAFRRAGIRAAQTTPLRSRNGSLLGMISTHWNTPHRPSERDLRMLDILARQAADLLDRTIAEEALRESETLQRMLTGELSHRVKNMLATVQAIASQTLRNCENPADFVESFGGRIQSMSRVHSQLSTNDWKGTRLRDIVADQMKLGPVDQTQISADGPDVFLDATAVPKMAMILHELGTNSLKYGALSNRKGAVAIVWTIDGTRLDLTWSEQGGPRIEAPVRRGFGTRLIEASVRGVGGKASMSVAEEGARWDIAFPLPADLSTGRRPTDPGLTGTSAARPASAANRAASHATLADMRILIVEDEPLLAMDMAGQLEDAGAHVVGPAADIAVALDLIERYRCDAALLDANLDGHSVEEIAAALTARDIPFLFTSGYGRESLPPATAAITLLAKPFSTAQLMKATTGLFEQAGAGKARLNRRPRG